MKMLIILFIVVVAYYQSVTGDIFQFPKLETTDLNKNDADYLNRITNAEWLKFIQLGTDSVNRQRSLEANLVNSQITVQNGSISHAQLLDTLPNVKAQEDSEVAWKTLKSSLYVYNTKCTGRGISGAKCQDYLARKQLPRASELFGACSKVVQSEREGHHCFRRLLPQHYKDGFYELYFEDEVVAPLDITRALYVSPTANPNRELYDEHQRSLSIVQWTQFVEHDLSKPVATSMSSGHAIECCNKDNYKLAPRYGHPACAPLLSKDMENAYGRETCLNYVRSALAVGTQCTFGAAEQLNQATGYLDLSQLYGYTKAAEQRMRTFRGGELKSTYASQLHQHLLPMANDDAHTFCALAANESNTPCFMAGDSRVNSNPFAIVLYTIFMRNHNQIARKLHLKHIGWNDERIFAQAKAINIDIYRRVVFEEWLPTVLGTRIADMLHKEPLSTDEASQRVDIAKFQVSNEFAVAAIRFYYSMMPNVLNNFATPNKLAKQDVFNNNILPDPFIFVLKDQLYKPDLEYNTKTLNDILESLLHQRAMKMDAAYVESLTTSNEGNARPQHADTLAVDIQRGRDHGLQLYVAYARICNNATIESWHDLEQFIDPESLNKLKRVYSNWTDIDLIVGGISEKPINDSTVGPTFTCILAEQFSKIRQWQSALAYMTGALRDELRSFEGITAADLFCENSDLKYVPKNIFQIASEQNPLISCNNRFQAITP